MKNHIKSFGEFINENLNEKKIKTWEDIHPETLAKMFNKEFRNAAKYGEVDEHDLTEFLMDIIEDYDIDEAMTPNEARAFVKSFKNWFGVKVPTEWFLSVS